MKLQRILSFVRRAVEDYAMIEEGDRIAVGISGGKDSLALLTALKALQGFYPKKFDIEAITVSLGFEGMNFDSVKELCDKIGVGYTVVDTDIAEIIFEARKEKNPCSLCAKMRKGALNDAAQKLNCNKVALGHNRDDIIETFFMSMFYEGRIHTASPVTYLDRKKIKSIRPLIYVPEKDIKAFVKTEGINVVKNKCPADGNTKREFIKNFIKQQAKVYDNFETIVFGAIKRSSIVGWQMSDKEGNK